MLPNVNTISASEPKSKGSKIKTVSLGQSAYLWFEETKGTVLQHGLTQSKHDSALFFDAKVGLYVTVDVEDIRA